MKVEELIVERYKAGEWDFREADLQEEQLSKADLWRSNLSGVNLDRADLTGFCSVPYWSPSRPELSASMQPRVNELVQEKTQGKNEMELY